MRSTSAFKLLILVLIYGSIGACNSGPHSAPEVGARKSLDSNILTDSAATSLPVSDAIFKGFYISADEVNTFRDCERSGKTYWVEDNDKLLKQAYLRAKDRFSYPNESFYCEVKGHLRGKSKTGYASEYEDVLVITAVQLLSQKSFNTNCFDYEFIALGNEPFWSAEIIPSEEIITFKDVAEEKVYVFPYSPLKMSEGNISYESSNERQETIKIKIAKEQCNDGMSDRRYNYSSQITVNGKSFTGCAVKNGDKIK